MSDSSSCNSMHSNSVIDIDDAARVNNTSGNLMDSSDDMVHPLNLTNRIPPAPKIAKKIPLVSKHAGTKFTSNEVDALLAIIEEHKPIGKIGWDQIGMCYNRLFPMKKDRGTDNLRKKYNQLANVRMPTGNPNIPPHVLKAKEIKNLIFEKSEALDIGVNPDTTIPTDIACLYEGFEDDAIPITDPTNSEQTIDIETPTMNRKLNPRVVTKKILTVMDRLICLNF
jgi:hypothetical protein